MVHGLQVSKSIQLLNYMFNKIALSTLAVSAFALPAAAGVYVNVDGLLPVCK